MDHPLDDSYLKVARALEHAEALRDEMAAIRDDHSVDVVCGINRKTGAQTARIVDVPRWPPNWSVVIGDIVHNLRSALDYLVFQLAGNPEVDRTAFPISEKERDYFRPRGRRKVSYRDNCLAGVDPKWAAWIDQLQPFNGPFPPGGAGELAILNWLSNRDKHRVRHPCYSVIELPFAFLTVEDTDLVRNLELQADADGGNVAISSKMRRPRRRGNRMLFGIDPKQPPNGQIGVKVTFGERRVSLPQLAMVISHVQFILDSVYPAFDQVAESG